MKLSFFLIAGLALSMARHAQAQALSELIQQVFHNDDKKSTSSEPTPNENGGGGSGNLLPDSQSGGGDGGGGGDGQAVASECECVPIYQCTDNGTINENGVGLIDIRLGSISSRTKQPCSCAANVNEGIKDRPCADYLDVCCKKPHTEIITPKPPKRRSCGERHPDGVGFRIIGDEDNETQFGEFPWMVAILRDQHDKKNVYQCGGSLIHPKVVLTAAHCVVGKKPQNLKIRAGEWDTQTTNELFPHQDRPVAKIITHKEYYAGALYNDVALLILESPVDLIDNVDVICLPKEGFEFNISNCVVSGWGKDVYGKEGTYQVILKKIELPIVTHSTCQDRLRGTRLGSHFKLHESFICAGGEPGKDACKGDGGSPLVCQYIDDRTRYQQVGIVAWGIGCGGDVPGVYVNIPLFREWIDSHLIKNEIDISPYEF